MLNYPNDHLILRLFSVLYAVAIGLQLYWDRHFILGYLPSSYNGIYFFLAVTLVINPFLKSKFSWTWLLTTSVYFILIYDFLKIQTGGDLYFGGSNFAMPFWVLLVLSAQKWLGPSRTIFLIKFLLLFSYFAAGVAKIRHGFDWMNGWTLQHYFLSRHMDLNIPEGWWLVENLTRAKILSWLLVVVELATPLAFFNRKLEWAFVIFYFSFQIACYHLMKLKFMNYYGWSYIIYLSIILIFLYERSKAKSIKNEPAPKSAAGP